jgi:hypothetical protein
MISPLAGVLEPAIIEGYNPAQSFWTRFPTMDFPLQVVVEPATVLNSDQFNPTPY